MTQENNTGLGPRVFGILAAEAPIVAVIRRGPSDWTQILLWNTEVPSIQGGSWLKGSLFPQRCDLSPDGTYLAYLATKYSGKGFKTGEHDGVFQGGSKLPWLSTLAMWPSDAWSYGMHFCPADESRVVKDAQLNSCPYPLGHTQSVQFSVEHRRDWFPEPSTPRRDPKDLWDQRREVSMTRKSPVNEEIHLTVEGYYAAWRSAFTEESKQLVNYWLHIGANKRALSNVQWAEFSPTGTLLLATWDGRLEMREPSQLDKPIWEEDLTRYVPTPKAPPQEALSW